MKRIWKILLISLAVVCVAIFIYFISRPPKKMNTFVFPNTVIVNNNTKYKIDTIVKVLINKVFIYDTATIDVFYANKEYENDELKMRAFIYPTIFDNRHYILFLSKNISGESVINEILSHELVHFDQYMKGDLYLSPENGIASYKGKIINFSETPYESRPFEKDAYYKQYTILKKLNDVLYN